MRIDKFEEIQSHLYAAPDLRYTTDEEFKNLYEQTNKVKKAVEIFDMIDTEERRI